MLLHVLQFSKFNIFTTHVALSSWRARRCQPALRDLVQKAGSCFQSALSMLSRWPGQLTESYALVVLSAKKERRLHSRSILNAT